MAKVSHSAASRVVSAAALVLLRLKHEEHGHPGSAQRRSTLLGRGRRHPR
jgi:hypothetical protein